MSELSSLKKPELEKADRLLVAAMQAGLPLCQRPYLEIGNKIGLSEEEVILRISRMVERGVIKRMGVVVRHRKLGYRDNAMVVWNVPDERVAELGRCIGQFNFITLCYRRPRRLPVWQYNLFCMIHGQDRDEVFSHINTLIESCGLQDIEYRVLFSKRCFKQRGAHYHSIENSNEPVTTTQSVSHG